MMNVLLNKKGMTLVEVMIAMVISLIIFLALMQTSLISINQNMRNNLRDEAGRIADLRMSALKNLPFDNPALADATAVGTGTTTTDNTGISRTIRNFSVQFAPITTVVDAVGTDTKEIRVTVAWQWKGQTFTNSVTSVLKRP